MTERQFIDALRRLPLHPGAAELRDDAATLEIGGDTLVLTHDMTAEGVHYLADMDPADIAWKLVAVNLSDLAAKGAEPIGVLIGASLGERRERFVEGLRDVLEAYGVPLMGGDTISPAPGAPSSHGCTAIGRATHTPVPRRSGARAGDGLWIAGTIGAAKLAFESVRRREPRGESQLAYLRPAPRLAEGRALAPHIHAMMDVSDGLLLDASRMAEASGLAVSIDLAAVPFAAGIEDDVAAACWGDDYALLFAAPPGFAPPVAAARIGAFAPGDGLALMRAGAAVTLPPRLGYSHGI